MTDEEYKINEERRDRFGEPGDIVIGSLRAAVMRAMNDGVRIRDASEIPSAKMRNISTVNFMIGKIRVAQEILDDVDGYNSRIEDYLGEDAKDEYEDALSRARRAVTKALELLFKEVLEQNKVLDPWKEEEK